ncbi:Na/Pi cotransporter family protein [Salaquimonas pukyongi]|uniref:Na/Pi cotransporter family protein n=1 Tax=Salaquimonas pukyongi TaxID=2712698 RepID=UPI00096B7FF7|nr:Na/Pi cotransporter family protein [Salaquimonas pukyongi]
MHPFVVLMHLAGAIMLLLWAVRMVRTGVERSYGAPLKGALRSARGGHAGIAVAGAALAVLLQSSTAVGVLAAGFATSGILTVATGIAALLGADLGSALVVKILSFDLSALIPILMFLGATMFLKFETRAVRQTGRIVLGIAFILISLSMVGEATQPMRESAFLPVLVGYLRGDPLTAFVLAAIFTWAVHSSVAAVLLLVTFASSSVLPLEVALPMVLGANVGGGIIAVWLTRGMETQARRIPLGNLIFRTVAALLAFALMLGIELPVDRLGGTAGQQLVNFHLLFNLALVLVSLPFVSAVARLTEIALPETNEQKETGSALERPDSALDRSTINTPGLALACAKRELLRMGETVETMYRPVMDLMDSGNLEQLAQIRRLDEEVNRRHRDIKLFIAEVNRGQLSEEEARHGIELTDFAINLEYIGDIIAKTLLPLVEEKTHKGLQFSTEGWVEMCRLYERVQANMQVAMNVLISGDIESARQLVEEKETIRRIVRDSHDQHLARLQSGNAISVETSDIHLQTIRALKEVNSLLVTVAYPILAESGQLLDSRLAQPT